MSRLILLKRIACFIYSKYARMTMQNEAGAKTDSLGHPAAIRMPPS